MGMIIHQWPSLFFFLLPRVHPVFLFLPQGTICKSPPLASILTRCLCTNAFWLWPWIMFAFSYFHSFSTPAYFLILSLSLFVSLFPPTLCPRRSIFNLYLILIEFYSVTFLFRSIPPSLLSFLPFFSSAYLKAMKSDLIFKIRQSF